jgi:hypothetical protein
LIEAALVEAAMIAAEKKAAGKNKTETDEAQLILEEFYDQKVNEIKLEKTTKE